MLVIAAAALVASGFLYGASADEEEYRFGLLSAHLHARAWLDGHYLLWTSRLGFGLPQPLGPSLLFHPLLPLLTVMSVERWTALVLAVQTGVLAAGTWTLGRVLGVSVWGRALLAATLLLSTPVQNYALTDFWPTTLLPWTVMPWLLARLLTLCEAHAPYPWRHAVATGLLGGLMVANGHPGYSIVFAPALLVMTGTHWRRVMAQWQAWAILATVAVLVAGPTLQYLASEFARFPSWLPRANYGRALALADLPGVFLRPFHQGVSGWRAATQELGARTLFFGGPFAALALLGTTRVALGRMRLDLVAAALVSLALLATPGLNRVAVLSGTFAFRDPLILCAAPIAVLVLDALWARGWRTVAAGIGCVQLVVLVLSAWPFLQGTWTTRQWTLSPGAVTRVTPLTSPLVQPVLQEPGRVYLSPEVEDLVMRGRERRDGWVRNSLAYHVPLVNGHFKGVSAGGLYPDSSRPYGAIFSDVGFVRDPIRLDVLGIRYVIALDGESVAPGLVERARSQDSEGRAFVLWRNPTASPGAVVIEDWTTMPPLSRAPDCQLAGLLCLDLAPLAARRHPDVVQVDGHDGRIRLTLTSAPTPRVVFVSEMYRPEWQAPSGWQLREAFGGLMFVTVPAGATTGELVYRPRLRIALLTGAWIAIAASLVAIALPRTRRHQ